MAAWPPVGGGRMVSTVNTITPWASPEATLAETSFHIVHRPWTLSAVSREAARPPRRGVLPQPPTASTAAAVRQRRLVAASRFRVVRRWLHAPW